MYTAISITFALALGVALGKLLQVGKTQSLLISFGTAICGGSAIAAMGQVLNANEEEMAVSLGTVFVLNSVALLLFPLIGHLMNFSQTQFGLWAALAIHDTSSVVGAGCEVWADGAGRRDDSEAGAGIVDCAAGDCYGDAEEEQSEGAVAVVHSVLLLCGGSGELSAAIYSADCPLVFCSEPVGARCFDCGAVSDRDRHYAGDVERSWRTADGAGDYALDCGGELVAMGDPRRMDFAVRN